MIAHMFWSSDFHVFDWNKQHYNTYFPGYDTISQWRVVWFFCYLIYTQPFAKCTAKCKKYFWRAGFHIYWSFSTWDNHVKLQTDWFKHLENYTKETKKRYMVSI